MFIWGVELRGTVWCSVSSVGHPGGQRRLAGGIRLGWGRGWISLRASSGESLHPGYHSVTVLLLCLLAYPPRTPKTIKSI